jgi:uncharacterized protein YbaP (TraB family)
MYHVKVARERGLLNDRNGNLLHERLLMQELVNDRVQEANSLQDELEAQLMIHRPDVWQEIQKEREEANAMGLDKIVYQPAPETMEEYLELEKMFDQFDDIQFVPIDSEQLPEATFFNGVSIEELGDN